VFLQKICMQENGKESWERERQETKEEMKTKI
jgi:hypothetical protein